MTLTSVESIVQALNAAQVKYLVVGGLAVVAHGYVRYTGDVDLLLELEEKNLLAGLYALASLGYRPMIPVTFEQFAIESNRKRWIEEKQMLVLQLFSDSHRETRVDIFVRDPLGFDQAYPRLKIHMLDNGTQMPVCGYDDLIQLKREAARPKDLIDLAQLAKLRGQNE